MAILYHEVKSDKIQSVLEQGLRRISRGDKGSDRNIKRTDTLLDDGCPKELKAAGVSRDNNLYCCIPYYDGIVLL